jgi:hypothetical protein
LCDLFEREQALEPLDFLQKFVDEEQVDEEDR